MVLKMTMSFTRSMAPVPTPDAITKGAFGKIMASERRVSNATVAAAKEKQLNQREERSASTASSSASSVMMDDIGLEEDGLDDQEQDKSVELTSVKSTTTKGPLARSSASAHGTTSQHGLIEISLRQDGYNGDDDDGDGGPSPSDLEAIDDLIESAKDGDLPLFQRLAQFLERRHITPDCAGYMGWTSAHWAARHGHVHILEYLLQQQVNLDLLDKKGDSLLHKAAANGQFRSCQWLLQHGFNVQARNNNGQTPLDVAQELLAMTRSTEAALCETILAREDAHTF